MCRKLIDLFKFRVTAGAGVDLDTLGLLARVGEDHALVIAVCMCGKLVDLLKLGMPAGAGEDLDTLGVLARVGENHAIIVAVRVCGKLVDLLELRVTAGAGVNLHALGLLARVGEDHALVIAVCMCRKLIDLFKFRVTAGAGVNLHTLGIFTWICKNNTVIIGMRMRGQLVDGLGFFTLTISANMKHNALGKFRRIGNDHSLVPVVCFIDRFAAFAYLNVLRIVIFFKSTKVVNDRSVFIFVITINHSALQPGGCYCLPLKRGAFIINGEGLATAERVGIDLLHTRRDHDVRQAFTFGKYVTSNARHTIGNHKIGNRLIIQIQFVCII